MGGKSGAESKAKVPSEVQKALEEFRFQVGQAGKKGGALKGIATGGKQNELTGRFFEYIRNDAFDAVPHEVRIVSAPNTFGTTKGTAPFS